MGNLIKTTPAELAVPSHDIEYEANALAEVTANPGVKDDVFLALARGVLRDRPFPRFTYGQQQDLLREVADRHLRVSKAETDKIVNVSRGNVISMLDLAPADRDHQRRFDEDTTPAA